MQLLYTLSSLAATLASWACSSTWMLSASYIPILVQLLAQFRQKLLFLVLLFILISPGWKLLQLLHIISDDSVTSIQCSSMSSNGSGVKTPRLISDHALLWPDSSIPLIPPMMSAEPVYASVVAPVLVRGITRGWSVHCLMVSMVNPVFLTWTHSSFRACTKLCSIAQCRKIFSIIAQKISLPSPCFQ